MNSDNVVSINNPNKIWSQDEANSMVAVLARIYVKHSRAIQKMAEEKAFMNKTGAPAIIIKGYDDKIQNEVKQWYGKMYKLGTKPEAVGWVSFNTGTGYLSWSYGEDKVNFFLEYGQQLEQRRVLS